LKSFEECRGMRRFELAGKVMKRFKEVSIGTRTFDER
jgi:hypothetical protein